MTFTRQQIEQWLSDLGKEAESREYAEAYKLGFKLGLVAVMSKMDDARKAAKDNHMHDDLVLTMMAGAIISGASLIFLTYGIRLILDGWGWWQI